MTLLADKKLKYIVPLRRSSSLIEYAPCEVEQRKGFTNYLRFNDRMVWYDDKQIDENQRVILYLDEDLRRAEQHDFLEIATKSKTILEKIKYLLRNSSGVTD